jgi:dipeptidyl aminopeptidase/acylaminoacyl peptidase
MARANSCILVFLSITFEEKRMQNGLFIRALLSVLAFLIQLPCAAAAPAPVLAFFSDPVIAGPRLSPSGKYLAARASKPGHHDVLVVFDLEKDTSKVVAAFNDVDVAHAEWVNDERLLFDVTDKQVPPASADYANGLYAVNRDGAGFKQLADRRGETITERLGTRLPGRALLPWHTFMLDQPGAQDSDPVYVTSAKFDATGRQRHLDLLRLNTVTGESKTVPRPDSVRNWLLDQAGEPRIATTVVNGVATIRYRETVTGQWRTIASFKPYGQDLDALDPVGFGPDGALYVNAHVGKDTSALHRFDPATGKTDPQAVISTAGYDFTGALVTTRDRVLGMRFVTDAEANEWIDPSMKAIQQKVDKLLPGTINLLSVPVRAETAWILVVSYADTMPAVYLLYNTKTGTLSKIGDTHPDINSREMGHQQMVRYKARDGLEIPALLTLPAGGQRGKLPLVVLVHGGPFVAGPSWGWNPESQFLASRGYAVLEPHFRGSTGLGMKHTMAGWKQWGLRMQDDLADGARWAIAQGIAAPKRACVAGASYGGYAALMGLVNDPDLFQCAIDWLGVTDINLLYTGTWLDDSDLPDDYNQVGMPVLIGDPVADAAQLKATSPIEQAGRIKQPLLLAYGGADRRVPLFHGKRFRDAVKRTNADVEWVEYPEEGHGWAVVSNRVDFWTRVEKFLDKHIGADGAASR